MLCLLRKLIKMNEMKNRSEFKEEEKNDDDLMRVV